MIYLSKLQTSINPNHITHIEWEKVTRMDGKKSCRIHLTTGQEIDVTEDEDKKELEKFYEEPRSSFIPIER